VSGLTTPATCGALATEAAAAFTASAFFGSVRVPRGAWMTIGLLPLAWAGKACSSASVARWLSVPGSDRESLVVSPSRWETTTAATVTTSHTTSTARRWRTLNLASPYSALVMPAG